mmetsp:Transcript_21922/g.47698  ORF Transcript_21922/g.47698 Transcript_21922/m.47698 type:complete len:270 (-) Transcript_21922:617-1426(-)
MRLGERPSRSRRSSHYCRSGGSPTRVESVRSTAAGGNGSLQSTVQFRQGIVLVKVFHDRFVPGETNAQTAQLIARNHPWGNCRLFAFLRRRHLCGRKGGSCRRGGKGPPRAPRANPPRMMCATCVSRWRERARSVWMAARTEGRPILVHIVVAPIRLLTATVAIFALAPFVIHFIVVPSRIRRLLVDIRLLRSCTLRVTSRCVLREALELRLETPRPNEVAPLRGLLHAPLQLFQPLYFSLKISSEDEIAVLCRLLHLSPLLFHHVCIG